MVYEGKRNVEMEANEGGKRELENDVGEKRERIAVSSLYVFIFSSNFQQESKYMYFQNYSFQSRQKQHSNRLTVEKRLDNMNYHSEICHLMCLLQWGKKTMFFFMLYS